MKIKAVIFTIFLLQMLLSFATHNRSGYITYRHIIGNKYEFTVKTCTKTSSQADRNELEIKWGDGTLDTIDRINTIFDLLFDVQENIYVGIHDFTGPGNYIISIEDPNRNSGVMNIATSVDQPFCVQTELIISPFIGTPNNSIVIEDCPCPEFACRNLTYCYNLSAYDPDGDSLSYALVPCRGEDCLEMAVGIIYNYPNIVGGGVLTLDSITGTLCWENPNFVGNYNLAIKISEFRNGVYIGAVLLDMQLTVKDCQNTPPVIADKQDTCVFAGEQTQIAFTATDAEDNIDIFATGQVLNLNTNPAIFTSSSPSNPVIGTLNWTPTCSQAKPSPHTIIIHAEDNNADVRLTDLLTYNIKVKIPPVQNVTANPFGGSTNLNWDDFDSNLGCGSFIYQIYRKIDSLSNPINDCCESSLIQSLGYKLIDTTSNTSYTDSNPLTVGNLYCYIITIKTDKGVESCMSNQACVKLRFEVPILTNVSVISTSENSGSDSIYWSWPKELNLTNFPGPYYYELYKNTGFNVNENALIYTTSINNNIELVDTFFLDLGLNTSTQPYNYQVILYSNSVQVGSSTNASSVWLSSIPNDNQLELKWEEHVPWNNEYYKIYKESPTGSGNFVFLDSTIQQTYFDTGLINLNSYCYKILSVGGYSENGIRHPIENWSQIHCNEPYDYTKPCPPKAYIKGNCDLEETYISWSNPNNDCTDDVVKYNLYFAPFEGDSLVFLTEINQVIDTFYTHKNRGSIAGCYYVTAIDSFPYANESNPSNIICIDNCEGQYNLPNVFTPAGDDINDLYHPILPYKFVESIEINIFNRYGNLVHHSTNPIINWDGTYLESGEKLSDGVYFYTCKVYIIKLTGIELIELNGTITIFNKK